MQRRTSVAMTIAVGLALLSSCQTVQDKERDLTEQCKKDWPCKKSGLCSGQCTPEPCICAAKTAADCSQSQECAGVGACTPQGGKCVVGSNDDCKRLAACKATGVCTAKDGMCVVGSDADCAQSDLCKDQRKCAFKGSACIDATFNPALLDPSKAGEPAPANFKVKFTTPKGEFVVEVTKAWAPVAADRFYNLVKIGYYNEAGFYRVDGGQAEFGVNAKPEVSAVWMSMKLKDEPNKQSNDRGTVAFPRPYPNSRWAPVVIQLKDNKELDKVGYAPFGKVVQGMNVVDALTKTAGEGAAPGKAAPDMDKLVHGGNQFLKANYPQMDFTTSVTLM
jgi:peptidyl-prolyl cis-trans isomerase A (cyclophilin A)